MFCDFDDCFASIYALRDYMTVLPADGFDFLYTAMLAEDGEEIYFTPKTQRFVFCHGKVYRRQFLIDQNIRFDEELTELLLAFRWWDKSPKEIRDLLPVLSCGDPERVKAELKKRMAER